MLYMSLKNLMEKMDEHTKSAGQKLLRTYRKPKFDHISLASL
jgi:hypothetical protein